MHGIVSWRAPRFAGLALLALGAAAFAATTQIHSARDGWSVDGPRFVPLIASVAVITLALAFLVRTVWRPDLELARFAAAEAAQTHWGTPIGVMAALLGYVALLTPAGWALATAIFLPVTARVLGSRHTGRDVAVGVLLGVLSSYVFSRWLGVRLPVGPWGV
jgi:putative tricarboxylic transport membrane protein